MKALFALKILLLVLMYVSFFITFKAFGAESSVTGLATYYTVKSCQREGTSGVYTASGKRYDESALTCAMRRRDWGSQWLVTNLDTGKTCIVTLTDYGPGKGPTAKGVVIDLTPAAFEKLGSRPKQGSMRVKVEKVTKQPK